MVFQPIHPFGSYQPEDTPSVLLPTTSSPFYFILARICFDVILIANYNDYTQRFMLTPNRARAFC